MIDDTGTRLIKWSDQVYRPLLQRWGESSMMTTSSERPFLRLFWVFDTVFGIELDQDTFLANQGWLEKLDVPDLSTESDVWRLDQVTDFVLHGFARFVRLNTA